MTRRVDNVDTLILTRGQFHHPLFSLLLPHTGHRSGRDRDATLLLLLHPIGRRIAIMHFTDPMDHPCIEEDALRQRRLACINVRRNPNIPRALQRIGALRMIGVVRHVH